MRRRAFQKQKKRSFTSLPSNPSDMVVVTTNGQTFAMDGNTPPMLLDPSINTPENQASIAVLIGLFVAIFPLFYFFQIVVVRWFLGQDKWAKTIVDAKASVEVISTNYRLVLQHIIAMPSRKEIVVSKGMSLFPFAFLLGLIISFGVIETAINVPTGVLGHYQINQTQAQGGMILFFVSCNGFLITRLNEFYRDKTEMRKKAAAHAFLVTNDAHAKHNLMQVPTYASPEIVADSNTDENGFHPTDLESGGSSVPSSAVSPDTNTVPNRLMTNAIFNKEFEYIRRIKHILPQYNHVSVTFGNFVQIAVLIIELVQLASFPYRDLLMNKYLQQSLQYQSTSGQPDVLGTSIVTGIQHIFSTISSGFPTIDTLVYTNIQFAIAWWISLMGALLAILAVWVRSDLKADFFLVRPKLRKAVTLLVKGPWIVYFEPLVSIFYLVILGSFVEPLGCLSSNRDPLWPPAAGSNADEARRNQQNAIALREQQCAPILSNPPLHVWCTLVGYMLGYYVLTIFKICDEQKPMEGIITFTTRSEVLNKNGSLVLLLLHALIPTTDSTTLRGSISLIVLIGMIFYQVRIGSSYVRPINFWRTISFTWVLWMSICILYFTHPNTRPFYGVAPDPPVDYRPWMRIALAVGVGWAIILVLYLILYLAIIRGIEKESTKPRLGISYNYNAKDDEDGRLTQIVQRAMASEPMNKLRKAFHLKIKTIPAEPAIPTVSALKAASVAPAGNKVPTPPPSSPSHDKHGTLKSIDSIESTASNTSSGSQASITSNFTQSSNTSIASNTTDRSAIYNSNVRNKVTGPRSSATIDTAGPTSTKDGQEPQPLFSQVRISMSQVPTTERAALYNSNMRGKVAGPRALGASTTERPVTTDWLTTTERSTTTDRPISTEKINTDRISTVDGVVVANSRRSVDVTSSVGGRKPGGPRAISVTPLPTIPSKTNDTTILVQGPVFKEEPIKPTSEVTPQQPSVTTDIAPVLEGRSIASASDSKPSPHSQTLELDLVANRDDPTPTQKPTPDREPSEPFLVNSIVFDRRPTPLSRNSTTSRRMSSNSPQSTVTLHKSESTTSLRVAHGGGGSAFSLYEMAPEPGPTNDLETNEETLPAELDLSPHPPAGPKPERDGARHGKIAVGALGLETGQDMRRQMQTPVNSPAASDLPGGSSNMSVKKEKKAGKATKKKTGK